MLVIVNNKQELKELVNYIFFNYERLITDMGEMGPNDFAFEDIVHHLQLEITEEELESDTLTTDDLKKMWEDEERSPLLREFDTAMIEYQFEKDFDRCGSINIEIFNFLYMKDLQFSEHMKWIETRQKERKEEIENWKKWDKQRKVALNGKTT